MAKLIVSEITTKDSSTNLVLSTGNTSAARITLNSANSNIHIKGSLNVAGGIHTTKLYFTGSNQFIDTYEFGDFYPNTADLQSGGNTVTAHWGASYGNYVKMGDLVLLYMTIINCNTVGQVAANDFYITNLPFMPVSNGALAIYNLGDITGTIVSATQLQLLLADATTYIRLYERPTTGSPSFLTIGEVANGVTDMYMTILYRAT